MRYCSVENCSKLYKAKGWCNSHHRFWLLYGNPLAFSRQFQHNETCSIEGCDKLYVAKGYCTAHYQRQRKGQEMNTPILQDPLPEHCILEGCETKPIGRGWCSKHYQAWLRYEDPLGKAQFLNHPQARKTKGTRIKKQGAMLWYKMIHSCADCGFSDPRALEFDHVRGEKKFNLRQAKSKPLKVMWEEVQKCDVVCANCHRIRTQERINKTGNGTTIFSILFPLAA